MQTVALTRAMQYRLFWISLSKSLKTGKNFPEALAIIKGQASEPDVFEARLIRMIDKIINFADTARLKTDVLSEYLMESKLFSAFEVAMVGVGWETGALAETTERLAQCEVGTRAAQYGLFYRALAVACLSHVPLRQGIWSCSIGLDANLKEALSSVAYAISQGKTMASAMRKSEEFSTLDVDLITMGEEYDWLDKYLLILAEKCSFNGLSGEVH